MWGSFLEQVVADGHSAAVGKRVFERGIRFKGRVCVANSFPACSYGFVSVAQADRCGPEDQGGEQAGGGEDLSRGRPGQRAPEI